MIVYLKQRSMGDNLTATSGDLDRPARVGSEKVTSISFLTTQDRYPERGQGKVTRSRSEE